MDGDQGARADALQAVLERRFWLPHRWRYRVREGSSVWPWSPWHHWWQSHALRALLDRHQRTGEPAVLARAQDLVAGIRRRNGGVLTNTFHDDMGWLALELLRLPGHDRDLATLLAAIRRGAAPDGGVTWSVDHPEFRNTPATGPAVLLALRLGARTGDDALLGWGLDLLDWLHAHLVDDDDRVADGLRVLTDGSTRVDPDRYSYNAGLVVAADLAAAEVTGDHHRRTTALRVARRAVADLGSPGVWHSEGPGDPGLFRSVLAAALVPAGRLDPVLHDALRVQANAIWDASRAGTTSVGCDWTQVGDVPVDLSEHLGALLVVEAAARASEPGR